VVSQPVFEHKTGLSGKRRRLEPSSFAQCAVCATRPVGVSPQPLVIFDRRRSFWARGERRDA
jgi:hypothetical protein